MREAVDAVIAAQGLSGAYVHFAVLVDQEPLNPLGWFGLSEIAWRSGDTERAVALSERGKYLQGHEPKERPAEPPPEPKPQSAATSGPAAPAQPTPPQGFVPYVPPEIKTRRYIFVVAAPILFCCCLMGASCLNMFNRSQPAGGAPAYPDVSSSSSSPLPDQSQPQASAQEVVMEAAYIEELNVGIDLPSEIAHNRKLATRGTVQRIEFRHPTEPNVFVRLEISPPGGPSPGETVRDLSARFVKAYPGAYIQQHLDTSGSRARWEFDQRTKEGHWLYKCDEFAVLDDGRNAAVMLVLPSGAQHRYLAVKDRILGSAESGAGDPGEGGP